MNTAQKMTLGFAAATLLVLSAPSARAAGAPEADWSKVREASRTVPIGDLDLASPAGRNTLRKRLQRAATQVCNELVPRMPGRLIDHGKCYSEVLQQALASVPGGVGQPTQRLAERGAKPLAR